MPVRIRNDHHYHDNEGYSFTTRSDRSRDFARRRRFGDDEDEDSGHVMSQVSSPLNLPRLGKQNRRSFSPLEFQDYQPPTRGRMQRETGPSLYRREKISGPARHALALCGELDEEDPYYKARLPATSQSHWEGGDCDDDMMMMPQSRYTPSHHYLEEDEPVMMQRSTYMTSQSNRYVDKDDTNMVERSPFSRSRKHFDNDEPIITSTMQRSKALTAPLMEDQSTEKVQRPRKRDYSGDASASYIMPVSRRRPEDEFAEEESAMRDMTAYITTRKKFAVEDDDDIQQLRNKKYQYRTRGLNRSQPIHGGDDAFERSRDRFSRAPMFDMKLRSHVIWEKMYVKFTCTIRGSPDPKVTWYHNMVAIEPMMLAPGLMKITSQYGVHTLEIFRASLEDSGTYRVSAQNHKGEISSYATLLVRRYDDGKAGYYDIKSGYNLKKPTDYPDVESLNVEGYPRFATKLYNKKVHEGDAVILSCHVEGKPAPEVFWTLNGRNIDDKVNHIQNDFDGKVASLTILRAYTDDEGEYVCRAYNSCGASTSRCFLAVGGGNAPPSAPTGVQVSDPTRNYVILSWNPPGYGGHFGGAPILGYFVEKAVAGSSVWRPANKRPIKLTKTPVTAVDEGQVYFFRIRAFNRWGRGPASMPVGPVAMRDPGTPRLPLELVDPETLIPPETDDLFVEEEEPSDLPGIPSETSAVLAPSGDCAFVRWKAPDSDVVDGFIIEYCENNNEDWRCVTSEPLQSTDPYPVSGLCAGISYRFRVLAVNGAGRSEPSEVTQVVSIGEDQAEGNIEAQSKEEVCDGNCDEVAVQQNTDEKLPTDETRYRGPPTSPRDVISLMAKREYIEVGWTPPVKSGGEQVRYFVEYRKLGTDAWLTANHSSVRYTQYPVGELEEGEKYMFRVRAVNGFGTSTFSEPSEPILASDGIKPPNWWGGVQGLFRVADDKGKPCVTKTSIKVCWEPPSSDGGSQVTGYYLEYRPCGGKFRQVNNKPLSQRHFTVNHLNPGEYYQFRVRACNVSGYGGWKVMPGRVQAKDPERPGEITDVNITGLSDDTVDLSWKKPKNIGDGEFVGYMVERRKEDADFWIPCNKLPEQVQDEKYQISGLIFGQTYFFRVTAVNKIGEGTPSLQSCYVTIGESLDDVVDRQNALWEIAKLKREIELERLRQLEEEERREAFSSRIKDCYVEKGAQACYECHVKDQHTKVTWYLGNWKEVTIEPVGKYDIISCGKRRALLVNNCCDFDVQAVHCVAQYNGCTSTADLVVESMAPVRFIRLPTDVYIRSGETAVLDCVLSKPNAMVTWTKNDHVMKAEDDIRYEVIAQGCGRSLIIKDVTRDDIAMYKISGLGGTYMVNLVVDGVLPVKFEKVLKSAELPYTASVATFECLADLSPLFEGRIPPCQWYHNGELIEPGDDKYEIISDGNTHMLKILNPTYEDNGKVTCVVEGGKTDCSIYVEKPPPPPPKPAKEEDYIINFEQGLRVEALPDSLRLFCIASNLRNDAKIIWYINDSEIKIDSERYKCFNNSESGLVSLVVTPISADFSKAKFTCEFITPLSTFDTKVNFEFDDGELEKMLTKAAELLKEEESERKLRKEEREKKKQDRKKMQGTEKISEQVTEVENPVPSTDAKTNFQVSASLNYDVTKDGSLLFSAQTTLPIQNCDVTWLKDSELVADERYHVNVEDDKALLLIQNPCADDAGTITCQIQSSETKCEASVDVTGKVFKQLLLKSAEIRIEPLSECDVIVENTEVATDVIADILTEINVNACEDPTAEDRKENEVERAMTLEEQTNEEP